MLPSITHIVWQLPLISYNVMKWQICYAMTYRACPWQACYDDEKGLAGSRRAIFIDTLVYQQGIDGLFSAC